MRLSTCTDVLFRTLGEEKGIKAFAEAGFDCLDLSLFSMSNGNDPLNTGDFEAYAKNLRHMAEESGLCFNQAHAPFPTQRYGNEQYNKPMMQYVKNSIKIAGIVGADQICVHPVAVPEAGQIQMDYNLEMYRELETVAREYGTRIAIENMWGYDKRRGYIMPNVCSFGRDLADYYDALNSDTFTVLLDIGHSGLIGEEPADAIRALGNKRLGALHVHDNNYKSDSHVEPFAYGASIDWNSVTTALGEIDYKGDLTFEADNYLVRFDNELLPACAKFLASIGRHLIEKIEAARK